MPMLFLHITLDSHVYPHYTKDMDMATRYLRRFCDIWLAVFCTLTLPWGGVVFAAVVVIVYLFTRKSNHTCWRIAMAAGCLSLCYMLFPLWEFTQWKLAGHWDAQEGLFYVFLFAGQSAISMVSILSVYGLCLGIRNLRA